MKFPFRAVTKGLDKMNVDGLSARKRRTVVRVGALWELNFSLEIELAWLEGTDGEILTI